MNDKATDHYNITLYEIEKGTSIKDIRNILKSYEDAQLFEECQGIHLALEIVSFNVLTHLIQQENNYKKIKIKWTQKE
ncbi:hypothetical protein UFOVP309_11 [uncultured Caudovirales phage]|uniref:Uncharacterized protein n=1 Tax=uncultured Caudovirales phage TaxID=2100421 RepID=A0A6J5PSK4_9CAUD|nr:hypothetical protein UFOVP309_11 [uncultured Caudovirales phage]CAB4173036.1 hypothetical protein UFOVP946_18 [uncultured Caudovirales phage]